jgi:hypothetical protein
MQLAKPQPDGRTKLQLTPLELIERLAAPRVLGPVHVRNDNFSATRSA